MTTQFKMKSMRIIILFFKNINYNLPIRIVVLLLREKDLRKTDNEMKGYPKLKQRHLEILGYRVIWIKKSIWNSMFMAEPEAKLLYLKSLVWPNT